MNLLNKRLSVGAWLTAVVAGVRSRFHSKQLPPSTDPIPLPGFLRFVPGFLLDMGGHEHLRNARAQQWARDWFRHFFYGARVIEPAVIGPLYRHLGHRHAAKRRAQLRGQENLLGLYRQLRRVNKQHAPKSN